MTIVEKSKVLQAYERASALGSGHEEACAVVARAMALDADTVDAVVREAEEQTA